MARAKKQQTEEVLSSDMIDTGTKATSLLDEGKAKKYDRTNTFSVKISHEMSAAWKDYANDVFKEKGQRIYFTHTMVDLLEQFLKSKGYPKD